MLFYFFFFANLDHVFCDSTDHLAFPVFFSLYINVLAASIQSEFVLAFSFVCLVSGTNIFKVKIKAKCFGTLLCYLKSCYFLGTTKKR